VRVTERPQRAGLALEALLQRRIVSNMRRQDLDGDVAAEARIRARDTPRPRQGLRRFHRTQGECLRPATSVADYMAEPLKFVSGVSACHVRCIIGVFHNLRGQRSQGRL